MYSFYILNVFNGFFNPLLHAIFINCIINGWEKPLEH